MSGMELERQFTHAFWLLGALIVAAFCGLLLALSGNAIAVLLLFAPLAWLVLLPYHADLVIIFGTVLFNTAFIVPYLTGRPFLWEGFGVLGWTGLVVTLALREQAIDTGRRIRKNWMLLLGLFLYAAVLLETMYFRGAGLKALGSAQIGGRIYFQQLITSIFPILFVIRPPSERLLVRLYLIQCLLSFSFVAADLAFAYASGPFFQLLNFLELPNDGLNFEQQAQSGGIRRFQSLGFMSVAIMSIIWIKYPIKSYFSQRGFILWPLTALVFLAGLWSGHRILVYISFTTLMTLAWSQRLFTVFRAATLFATLAVLYALLFFFCRDLPLSSQRAVSFIPGIDVDPIASYDAWITLNGRRLVRDAGWEESKKYRWLGRGFSKQKLADEYYPDQTYMWVDWGVFYNGTVGTLVNLGVPGALAFLFFLIGGTRCALRIVRYVRLQNLDDDLARLGCVICGGWFAQTFSFIFMHGDSEFAMRTFALPAAFLITCDYWLQKRSNSEIAENGQATSALPRVIRYAVPELESVSSRAIG